jgi:hypothetical protein
MCLIPLRRLKMKPRLKSQASKAQSVSKPLKKLHKHHCINREQMETDMSRPLFAVTVITLSGFHICRSHWSMAAVVPVAKTLVRELQL